METFKSFTPGDSFRLKFNHRLNGQNYPEDVYCVFKSCTYLGSSSHIDELVVDQIIDVKEYLEKGEFRTQERRFKQFDSFSIFYHMHD